MNRQVFVCQNGCQCELQDSALILLGVIAFANAGLPTLPPQLSPFPTSSGT